MTTDSRVVGRFKRRDFVRIGGGAFTLAHAWLARQGVLAASPAPRARRAILLWLDGGPSHLETFDPKPAAPAEVRGPFGSIPTAVPGLHLGELLPRMAAQAERLLFVRSLTSPLGEHNFGAHYLLTGFRPTPALEYPAVGSVVAHLLGQGRELPSHVAIPDFRVGGARLTGGAFLPPAAHPFAVGGDPGKPGFRVQDLDFLPDVGPERLSRRRSYLGQLDSLRHDVDAAAAEPADPFFAQAFRLLETPEARSAFRLDDEPQAVRERYGPRTLGQSCLLARRLLERGVPFVTVNSTGWDTHDSLVTRLKEGYAGAKVPVGLIPTLDQACSALLDDLQERGMLADTLVLVVGEFGRTPKLNTRGGRDHWPRVFSAALAGAGIAGGVLGASDEVGESPLEPAVTPADLSATVYQLLGLPANAQLRTPDGRPIALSTGTPFVV